MEAHPEPRVVLVKFDNDGRVNKHKFMADLPTILQVCQESQMEALKDHKIRFATKWRHNRVYFNHKLSMYCLLATELALLGRYPSILAQFQWGGPFSYLSRNTDSSYYTESLFVSRAKSVSQQSLFTKRVAPEDFRTLEQLAAHHEWGISGAHFPALKEFAVTTHPFLSVLRCTNTGFCSNALQTDVIGTLNPVQVALHDALHAHMLARKKDLYETRLAIPNPVLLHIPQCKLCGKLYPARSLH
jgi:hypothetical protein